MLRCYLIIAYDMESTQIYSLTLPTLKGDMLFKQFDYDFDDIANHLRLFKGKLSLRLMSKEQAEQLRSRTPPPKAVSFKGFTLLIVI